MTLVCRMAMAVMLVRWTFPSLGQESASIVIDSAAGSTPLSHFWESGFGSGQAILSVRGSYRDDLREVKKATGIQ